MRAEFVSFTTPILNDNGKLAVSGFTRISNSGPSFSGLFTHQPGNTRAEIFSGTQAPGTSNGVVFDRFGTARLNNADDVASAFSIEGVGVNSSNDTGTRHAKLHDQSAGHVGFLFSGSIGFHGR